MSKYPTFIRTFGKIRTLLEGSGFGAPNPGSGFAASESLTFGFNLVASLLVWTSKTDTNHQSRKLSWQWRNELDDVSNTATKQTATQKSNNQPTSHVWCCGATFKGRKAVQQILCVFFFVLIIVVKTIFPRDRVLCYPQLQQNQMPGGLPWPNKDHYQWFASVAVVGFDGCCWYNRRRSW